LSIEGENLPAIQNILNHKSLAPTSIYARLNVKAVDRALQSQADRFSSLATGLAIIESLPATEKDQRLLKDDSSKDELSTSEEAQGSMAVAED
jgi:hypothetical protein